MAQITEIDKGIAEVFVKAEDETDFEVELTDITKETSLVKLLNLFQTLNK